MDTCGTEVVKERELEEKREDEETRGDEEKKGKTLTRAYRELPQQPLNASSASCLFNLLIRSMLFILPCPAAAHTG
eukprot:765999-Hanusia_phi.AAC.2